MVEHLSSMQIVVGSIPTTAKRNLKPYCHVIQPPHNGMHSTGLKAGSKKKCKLTCYSIVYSSLNLAGAQTSTDRSMREHHTASKYQKTLLDATLMNSKDFMQPKRDTQLQLYVQSTQSCRSMKKNGGHQCWAREDFVQFVLMLIYFYFMCLCENPHLCMCCMCVPGARGGQKRVSWITIWVLGTEPGSSQEQ